MGDIRRSQGTFTLIELMVVVAIIGILATVVVVSYSEQLPIARQTKVRADFASYRVALRMYALTNGRLPDSLEVMLVANDRGGPWLEKVSKDPWGREYLYEVQSANKFVLVSYGADGQPGGEGEDRDLSTEDEDPR